jgi:hypothetical protein
MPRSATSVIGRSTKPHSPQKMSTASIAAPHCGQCVDADTSGCDAPGATDGGAGADSAGLADPVTGAAPGATVARAGGTGAEGGAGASATERPHSTQNRAPGCSGDPQ